MKQLAILGGEPVIENSFPIYQTLGVEEELAVKKVIQNGVLSAYIGAKGEQFLGGACVRQFEEVFAEYFGVEHAVAVNSWTSGLIAAVGALGIEPGDEVIVTPWTMAATVTAILHWNAIPVFADIDPQTFNLNPIAVEQAISPYTKAIMVADIFGQGADMPALREIADRHDLKIIGDTAQAPGAFSDGKYTGTAADIGGFSFNYHKHMHCGEGGVVVTNDEDFARRLQLIRNHAEAVIESDDPNVLKNLLGYNFRMGEIEATIALEQLKKLEGNVASRQRAAKQLDNGLKDLQGLSTPFVSKGNTHVYYVYGITLDVESLGVSRKCIIDALRAEGVPSVMEGYQNIHRLPLFKNRIAYGSNGFPWSSDICKREVTYSEGLCPVAEKLHDETFIGLGLCAHMYDEAEVELMIQAFHKVWENREQLKSI